MTKHTGLRIAAKRLVVLAMSFMLAGTGLAASTETVLHLFGPGEGADLESRLVFDRAGNLYGTTYAGGLYTFGTVFELSPVLEAGASPLFTTSRAASTEAILSAASRWTLTAICTAPPEAGQLAVMGWYTS